PASSSARMRASAAAIRSSNSDWVYSASSPFSRSISSVCSVPARPIIMSSKRSAPAASPIPRPMRKIRFLNTALLLLLSQLQDEHNLALVHAELLRDRVDRLALPVHVEHLGVPLPNRHIGRLFCRMHRNGRSLGFRLGGGNLLRHRLRL